MLQPPQSIALGSPYLKVKYNLSMFLLLAGKAYSKDRLIVQFTIEEHQHVDETVVTSKYTNAILQGLNETNSYTLASFYILKLTSTSSDSKNVNIVLMLKDVIDQEPYYIGADSVNLTVGDSHKFKFIKD